MLGALSYLLAGKKKYKWESIREIFKRSSRLNKEEKDEDGNTS
jgi:hypothetical protein